MRGDGGGPSVAGGSLSGSFPRGTKGAGLICGAGNAVTNGELGGETIEGWGLNGREGLVAIAGCAGGERLCRERLEREGAGGRSRLSQSRDRCGAAALAVTKQKPGVSECPPACGASPASCPAVRREACSYSTALLLGSAPGGSSPGAVALGSSSERAPGAFPSAAAGGSVLVVHGFWVRSGAGANPIGIPAAAVLLLSLGGPYCGCGGSPGHARWSSLLLTKLLIYLLREGDTRRIQAGDEAEEQ